MNYGNANKMNQNCLRCGQSIDKHKVNLISSDDKTEKMAKDFQQALDNVLVSGALKGYAAARGTCMVGVARAKIGSATYTFATISGADISILNQVSTSSLGKDAILIKEGTALPLQTIAGQPVQVTPRSGARGRDYPVGACAAQKLLKAIFKKCQDSSAKLEQIHMAEILWSDPTATGHNRDWSTGEVVCSCDTCMQVVPAMLCNAEV